ncbi:hypothetical protein ACFLZM_00670 [Thermodesulfobacteriota bacterium]
MDQYILVVETNCKDAAREDEYNEWYDKIHLPDVLETNGVMRAVRYENTDPTDGNGKFLAVYDIETDDIDETMKALGENVAKKRDEGRMTDLLERVSRGVYKRTSSLSK